MPPIPADAASRQIITPRTMPGHDWAAAHESALAEAEPVFVTVRPFADERGWSLMNLLAGALDPAGQINFSRQDPGVVKAWHRHQRQTDFWICVDGVLKVGVWREEDAAAWSIVTGPLNPGVVIIPPGLWHGGMTLGPAPAGLLYYVSNAYDPANPDEERRPWDSVPGFRWAR